MNFFFGRTAQHRVLITGRQGSPLYMNFYIQKTFVYSSHKMNPGPTGFLILKRSWKIQSLLPI